MKNKKLFRMGTFLRSILMRVTTFAVLAIAFVVTFISIQSTQAVDMDADFVYLSDIRPYSQKVGWGSLSLDKASNGNPITMRVEGSTVSFDKGIFAHATSTLIYDLTDYNFDYFTGYFGINTSSSSGNGVKFSVALSMDGSTWNTVDCGLPAVTMPGSNATFVKVDIRGAKRLRLIANDNGANGNDHSAYGDAKLIKAGYSDNVTSTVEEYDEVIRQKYAANGGNINDELELLILQRDLVKKVGNYQLKQIYNSSEDNKAAFEWLFNDRETLKMYIMGGQPDGTYKGSFEVLAKLLKAHRDDLDAAGTTPAHGIKYSKVYKKMMITLALTHSRTVNFWVYGTPKEAGQTYANISNAVERYEIYKELFEANKLNAIFDQLEVEEMRYIMASQINDDEIKWARDYAMITKGGNYSPYAYLQYKNVNTALYRQEAFFANDITSYKTKYKLDGYDVRNEAYFPRLWMIMEVGGVCWQLSNVGQSMVSAMGVPAILIGQPSHSSYLVQSLNANGNATWGIWNDVGGWTVANTSAYNGTRGYFQQRLLASWGNGSYASGSTVSYVLLGQAAINDFSNYMKAEEHVKLAESMTTKAAKEHEYHEALRIQSINFDAWLGLVNLYKSDESTTQEQYLTLAEDIAESLKYFPHPMYDLHRLIGQKVTEPGYMAALAQLTDRTLREATKATAAESLQYNVTRTMANYFLGKVDTQVATFSFDGEDAGKIKLASKYTGSNAAFDYRLSNTGAWSNYTDAGYVQLSDVELASINSTDGIQVHIIGVNYDEKNIYTIKINESTALTGLYANDLENRVAGADNTMEWRMEGERTYKSFADETPDLSGNKTVYVRKRATGTTLPSAEQRFTFTTNVDDPNHRYIMSEDLTVAEVSSENVRSNRGEFEYAAYALDGNLYTHWHTDRTVGNDPKYIVIELAEERYVSRFEYVPVPDYNYGVIKEAEVLVSNDKENWTKVADITDWPKNNAAKHVDFEPVKTKYVKLQVIKNYDYLMKAGTNYFVSAAMLNLYEDSTKSSLPNMRLEYSTRDVTNENVTVTLVNPTPENAVTIDNNDGQNTYTFTRNGEFTFEFHNSRESGRITAKVSWIDKTAPKASVRYEKTTTEINGGQVKAVKATITLSEDVKFTNENFREITREVTDASGTTTVVVGYKFGDNETLNLNEDGSLSYLFTYNHGFTLQFEDMAGNTGSQEVKVDDLTVTEGNEVDEPNPDDTDNPSETDNPSDTDKPSDNPTPKPPVNNGNNNGSVTVTHPVINQVATRPGYTVIVRDNDTAEVVVEDKNADKGNKTNEKKPETSSTKDPAQTNNGVAGTDTQTVIEEENNIVPIIISSLIGICVVGIGVYMVWARIRF